MISRFLFIMGSITVAIMFALTGCKEEYVTNEEMELYASELSQVQNDPTRYEGICNAFEIYDLESDLCSLPETCTTTAECEALGDKLILEIMSSYGDLLTDYEFSDADNAYYEQVLAKYDLDGNTLTKPKMLIVDEGLDVYRDDIKTHVETWDMFAYLIPANEREMLSKFYIFTDGNEETLAQVEPDDDDISKWWLSVDVMDADERFILKTTLLHEFSHLMTLEESQMDMDENVVFLYDGDDGVDANKEAAANCPNYFVDSMGCTKEDSYLNQFYHTFWADIIDDWTTRGVSGDEDEAMVFFEDYEDQFVTDYAVTSASEDIAEVWTYFILSPRYESEEIWQEKIEFFYQYPEQVALRAEILSRMLSYLSQHEE